MNSMKKENIEKSTFIEKRTFAFLSDGRIKDVLIVSVLAFILTFTVWKVFNNPSSNDQNVNAMSETEKRISQILSEIDGVGKAEVIISENEDGIHGAVVVCEGANSIKVIMDVREAVSTALNIEAVNIKIYLKKD